MIKKPRRNDNLDQLCNISFPRQVFRPLSVQEQLPNSGSKSKRPRKQTAVMTESLHQEETLSPKKKQKKKEPTSKDGKRQSKRGLAKKAEEASAIRDGIEILNSLPAFQTNFPSRSKESTTSQNSQLSLVGASSPNMSQLPSVHTTPQLSQLASVLPSAQWPQQSQLCAVQFSALQQRELPVKSNPPSNQLPLYSVPPNQPIQSVPQNQLPIQSTPHSNQMSVPAAPPSNQPPVHSVPPNQPIQSVLQNQLPVQSTPHPNQRSAQSTLPLNQLLSQSATPTNQLLPPAPPSRRSSTPLQNDNESSSSSSSSLQLQLSPSETRLAETAETFCAAVNVADDFLLLDDYPQVTPSRHETICKETVADASLQAIAALQEENNKLIKENKELREKVASICRYPGKFSNLSDYCDV